MKTKVLKLGFAITDPKFLSISKELSFSTLLNNSA